MKKFLFLKIFFLALYSPTIFAITCSTGSGGSSGGDSSSATYTWKEATKDSSAKFTARLGHTSVSFDNKIWVISGRFNNAGYKPDVWRSADGKTWTTATDNIGIEFRARYYHSSVVFDDGTDEKMWVIAGWRGAGLNDVWSSTNGATWTRETDDTGFIGRSRHASVVFDDDKGEGEKMWVIGGFDDDNFRLINDVWSSTNGKTWTLVKPNDSNGFSARQNLQAVVFDDGTGSGKKIYVIGGSGKNDVWSSANGKDWTEVRADGVAGGFSTDGHRSVVFDDKMWVIGGYIGNTRTDDVWSSTDGVTWTKEADSGAGFEVRQSHSSVVFDSKVWVIGGDGSSQVINDVWSMEKD